jgi:hyperosmotically inducible periplasmic protein
MTIKATLASGSIMLLASCSDREASSTTTAAPVAVTMAGGNNGTVDADNSAKNERDRNGTTLTAGDQGTSETDRQITKKIRRMVVSSTNHFSMTAKNVKIITVNGKVTLRGPVTSDDEKTGIERIAKAIAGGSNVEDQLEVKANP